jgi:hypothetical protein
MGKFTDRKIAAAADIANIERFIDAEELETAIASAVSAGITEAISEGGAIETWGDGRYTKQTD